MCVTFDLARVHFAPFREVGIVILRTNLHRASVNGLLESLRQRHLGGAASLAQAFDQSIEKLATLLPDRDRIESLLLDNKGRGS